MSAHEFRSPVEIASDGRALIAAIEAHSALGKLDLIDKLAAIDAARGVYSARLSLEALHCSLFKYLGNGK